MINKITRENCTELGLKFDKILSSGFKRKTSYEEYRKGSSFFIQWVFDITEEDCKKIFPNHLFLVGLWETNQFVHDTNYGYDRSEIDELTRVNKIEREVVTIEITYEPIEDEDISGN